MPLFVDKGSLKGASKEPNRLIIGTNLRQVKQAERDKYGR